MFGKGRSRVSDPPGETIEAHHTFIRRRANRPSYEHQTPTEEEWDSSLSHFEMRKISIDTCTRACSSPCVHEHVLTEMILKRLLRIAAAARWLKVTIEILVMM
ncbi:hypothetical protein ABT025_36350 [Streptomyces sp. NPDC002809]|uniref:hypothetical protein n=1 Tax=Streptomyces sp. NPDC002809 TaxID=3154433 RepID=UPI00332B02DD